MENLLGPRDANGIPVPLTVEESIASMKASLLKKIKRSAYVYRVDCGGCNGCEIEIFATLSPLFDAERFGIKVVPSPRHADILLFTGAVTRAMRSPALRALAVRAGPENLHLVRCLRQQRRHLPRPVLRLGRHRQNRTGGRLHSGLPADARRDAVRFCHGARPAGAENPRPRAGRAGQPASHYPAPGYGAAAAGEDRPHGAQAGGLPLWPPDCRRLSAPAEPRATIRWRAGWRRKTIRDSMRSWRT